MTTQKNIRTLNSVEGQTSDAIRGKDIKRVETELKALDNPIYFDIWTVGVQVSLRISDLLSLRYSDLIKEDGTCVDSIYIREQKTERLTRKKPKKVTINNKAKQVIERRFKQYPNHEFLFQSDSKRNELNGVVKPIDRCTVTRQFKRIGNEISKFRKVRLRFTSHSMRKTKARALYDAGVPLEKICQMLGHSSPEVTMRYLGITDEELDELYNVEI